MGTRQPARPSGSMPPGEVRYADIDSGINANRNPIQPPATYGRFVPKWIRDLVFPVLTKPETWGGLREFTWGELHENFVWKDPND